MAGDQTLMLKIYGFGVCMRFRLVSHSSTIWMFPKIVVPPNHPF